MKITAGLVAAAALAGGVMLMGKGKGAEPQGGDLAAVPSPAIPAGNFQQKRSGPLASLPSAEGPHLQKIKALGDNQWLNLGSPAADPKWGRARGRAFSTKAFALAPELRGAFFAGEGVHAFVKPNGFGMDDYWVYDINAHRWICLYPGTDTKNFNRKVKEKEFTVDDNGQVVDKDGQPIPGHVLIHAWGFLTYDTEQRKFVAFAGESFNTYYMPGLEDIDEGLKALQAQAKGKKHPPFSPWFIDSATGKFERYPASSPWPAAAATPGGYPQFLYISSRKQHFVGGAQGVAFYDAAKRVWSEAKDQGPRPPGYDQRGCYDSKRERVYMGGGILDVGVDEGFYVYDLKSATWTKPAVKKETYPALSRLVHCDSVNDTVVMMQDRKIYAYHPETNTWAEPLPTPAEVFSGYLNAFYDPALNVHFVFSAGDSEDNGSMWVYRYKNLKR